VEFRHISGNGDLLCGFVRGSGMVSKQEAGDQEQENEQRWFLHSKDS
jgi:hypothetical protein